MKVAFALLLAFHGAIHLLGFAKGFGLAEVSQLTVHISRSLALLWLAAGLASLATAALLFVTPERWWIGAAIAVVLSQAAIFTAWSDARFGTVANVIVLVPLALALLDLRGSSLRSTYRREAERGLAHPVSTSIVTEADLAPLPPALQTYLRRAKVVGRPHVHDLRAHWRGQMRNGADGAWMDVGVDQVELFDPPTRLFYMEASQHGLPFAALHVYRGSTATMRVRVASLFDVVDAKGPEMNRSETVTLFNDMCVLAPASLLDAKIEWQTLGERRVSGTFSNAGNRVSAVLVFDDAGDLVDFVSNDRDRSADGKTYENLPWSTPLRDYKDFGGTRIAAHGDAVWKEPAGDFVYARFELESLELNVAAPAH
jgi:hypothetical protein